MRLPTWLRYLGPCGSSKFTDMSFRSHHSVSVALKQWSQRKVSVKLGSIRKCRFLQCKRALKCLNKRSWRRRKREEVFQQHCAQQPFPLFRAKGSCQAS